MIDIQHILIFGLLFFMLDLIIRSNKEGFLNSTQDVLKHGPPGYYRYFTMHQPYDKHYYNMAFGAGYPIRF